MRKLFVGIIAGLTISSASFGEPCDGYKDAYYKAVEESKRLIIFFEPAEAMNAAGVFAETLASPEVATLLESDFVFLSLPISCTVNGETLIESAAFKDHNRPRGVVYGYTILGANEANQLARIANFPFLRQGVYPYYGDDAKAFEPWTEQAFVELIQISGSSAREYRNAFKESELYENTGLDARRASTLASSRIARFCGQNVGRRVGSGDCYQLVSGALGSIGFRGNLGRQVSYLRNGRIVGPIAPGYILHMSGFNWRSAEGRPHRGSNHYAIVRYVSEDQRTIGIYHQNTAGRTYVVEDSIYLPSYSGGLIIYQP